MGKYSHMGSSTFDEKVDADLQQVVDAVYSMDESALWVAILLMGGYGRGEGTPFIHEGKELPYNDYDFILVSQDIPFWKRSAIQKKLRSLEEKLSQQLNIHVDLYLHTLSSLKRAPTTMMNYELKRGHRVLKGPAEILNVMPEMETIPLIEGTRLLLNRGTLLLYNRERHLDRTTYLKYILKAYLAFGDCLLLASNHYHELYSKKKERINNVKTDLTNRDWYVNKYIEAVQFKEWGDLSRYDARDLNAMQDEACHYFTSFLRWYEENRLSIKLKNDSDYTTALEKDGFANSHRFKSMALNICYMGFDAIKPSFKWLWIYPRYKLYAAIWLIFNDEKKELKNFFSLKQFFELRDRFG